VLPPPHVRVPETQIHDLHARTKRLFEGDTLNQHIGRWATEVLRQSLQDLHHPEEMSELGMAIFLDRPLGGGKAPLEHDGTRLLSYVAFSRSIAEDRLNYLRDTAGMIETDADGRKLVAILSGLNVQGVPVEDIATFARPALVSLTDALKAAQDFVLLHTTRQTQTQFLGACNLGSLLARFPSATLGFNEPMLILRTTPRDSPREMLTCYDSRLRRRLELDFDPAKGYVTWRGLEYPVDLLHVLRVWVDGGDQLREHDVRADQIAI
jgi:hypothetical protein